MTSIVAGALMSLAFGALHLQLADYDLETLEPHEASPSPRSCTPTS